MTGQAKLMRKANSLCKAIRQSREEVAQTQEDSQAVRFARSLVGQGTVRIFSGSALSVLRQQEDLRGSALLAVM